MVCQGPGFKSMTFGDKLTQEEIDDIFTEFEFDDDGFILTNSVVSCWS